MDLSTQLSNLSLNIDSILDIRNKIRLHDGAYRRGDDIIIVSHSIRTVRGLLKYTFLDGNPPGFSNFSLYGFDLEETDDGKSFFMLDGTTPYSLSILEANYIQTLIHTEGLEPEFIPSLYYSQQRDDFFILNVDGTEKHLFHIPFQIQYIDSHDYLDYVIHYTPHDRDGWCEPITQHQAKVICRFYCIHLSELSPYDR
jgi:hypothetical protein